MSMSSTKLGGATATLFRQAATSLQPCTCSSAAARQFSSSAKRTATVLKAEKLDKGNDPLDMTFLQEFGYDDLPASSHRIIENDREKLHLLRLIQFQLPEIRSKMRRPYNPPSSSQFVKLQTIYHPADPNHPASKKAVITVSADAIQSGAGYLDKPLAKRKFRILAGSRFDPKTDTVKISCDRFPTLSMNQKWCSDALSRLIKEAEDLTDDFSDLPQAEHTREARRRLRPKKAGLQHMPKEWLQGIEMTPSISEDLVDVEQETVQRGQVISRAKYLQPKGEERKKL